MSRIENVLMIVFLTLIAVICLWMLLHWQKIKQDNVLHGAVDFSFQKEKHD